MSVCQQFSGIRLEFCAGRCGAMVLAARAPIFESLWQSLADPCWSVKAFVSAIKVVPVWRAFCGFGWLIVDKKCPNPVWISFYSSVTPINLNPLQLCCPSGTSNCTLHLHPWYPTGGRCLTLKGTLWRTASIPELKGTHLLLDLRYFWAEFKTEGILRCICRLIVHYWK